MDLQPLREMIIAGKIKVPVQESELIIKNDWVLSTSLEGHTGRVLIINNTVMNDWGVANWGVSRQGESGEIQQNISVNT